MGKDCQGDPVLVRIPVHFGSLKEAIPWPRTSSTQINGGITMPGSGSLWDHQKHSLAVNRSLSAHPVVAQVLVLWQHGVVWLLCADTSKQRPVALLGSFLILYFELSEQGKLCFSLQGCQAKSPPHWWFIWAAQNCHGYSLICGLRRTAGFMEPNSKARLYIREIQLGMSQHQKENKLLLPPPKMPKGTVRKSIIALGLWGRWARSLSLEGLGK